MTSKDKPSSSRLLNTAFYLSIITIGYNIAEGLVSTFFGMEDKTIALFGFGVDSFVEVISGIGIAHMVLRMKKNSLDKRDRFERQALFITGTAFYLLTIGLVFGSVLTIVSGNRPETTLPGVIIAVISIATMWFLYQSKMKVGKELNSDPIIADAHCTKTCFYLSFLLLTSSFLYEVFRISYIDVIGGLGIAYFAFNEGRESFEKARTNSLSCSCNSGCCR
jgi:divalent metal cation (Fe/Co/Zn/Cd) transporter